MTKKSVFKGVATILLVPGGFIFAALVAVVLAGVLAVMVYFVAFWAVCQELAMAWRRRSFRKASQTGNSASSVAALPRGLPEDLSAAHRREVWDGRQAAHRKYLQ